MAGILSGLASLGLGNLAEAKVFEEEKVVEKDELAGPKVSQIEEKDLVYDKAYDCPVCAQKITSKVMKSGKAKLLGTDNDLRPKYEGIDPLKYDVVLCPHCGYASLSRYFKPMPPTQVRLIKENISKNVRLQPMRGEIYTYDETVERYKLALACSIVKQAKASEKAYVCLKSAWVLRGMAEELNSDMPDSEAKRLQYEEDEKEYLMTALEGFISARQSESFPMCGMDECTVDYLIAVLAVKFGKYDTASRLVATILTSSSANVRMKDKARDLKDIILAELKNSK